MRKLRAIIGALIGGQLGTVFVGLIPQAAHAVMALN
jgi:hypothetical protein